MVNGFPTLVGPLTTLRALHGAIHSCYGALVLVQLSVEVLGL